MKEKEFEILVNKTFEILRNKLTRRERALIMLLIDQFVVDKNGNINEEDFNNIINNKLYELCACAYEGSSMRERLKTMIRYIEMGVL